MYRGRKIQVTSFPNGFDEKSYEEEYTIKELGRTVQTSGISKILKQSFQLIPVKPQENPDLYIERDFVTKGYEYHNSVLYQPVDVKDEIITPSAYPKYSFRDQFNYRPPAYIEYLSNINEHDIPNFYLSVMDDTNDKYESSFVLKGDLSSRKTFEDVSIYIANKRQRTESEIEKTNTILVTKEVKQYKEGIDLNGDNIKDIQSLRNIFPLAVNINFDYQDTDLFSNMMDKLKLHQSMLAYLKNTEKSEIGVKITDVDFGQIKSSMNIQQPALDFDDYLRTLYFKKYYDYIVLPDKADESVYSHNIKKFKANLELQTNGYIPQSFLDIKNRMRSPSELLYLKIEKYIGKNTAGEPFQTFFMSGNSATYEYYDTQVKNKEFYTYKITGIFMLSGTKYDFKPSGNGIFEYTAERSRRIVEYPVLTKTVYVLQPLPLVPKVNVYRHKDKNKVYFYLRLNTEHTRYEPFKPIVEGDNVFDDILETTKQYQDPEHGFVTETARFEVFKTTTEPKSLADLRESFLLETKAVSDRTDHLFVDHIEYDQEYYYLFRAVNNENFPGNPTIVFKVRMQKGVEENKLHIERVRFIEKTEEYDIKKNFNKLIHILPNENQNIMTNLQEIQGNSYTGTLEHVKVGLDSVPKVWDKKFKMRVTSNNTGKKIDLNVKFSIKRKVLETE